MGNLTVLAFHGDTFFLDGPSLLQRDMGDPPWVDFYPDWKKWEKEDLRDLKELKDVVLIGYSRGGSYIAELTHLLKDNLRGVVLYESPLLKNVYPYGNAPALIIWNNKSRYRNTREAQDTRYRWGIGKRPITELYGMGGHIKWFPLGHGWDTQLNPMIYDWIQDLL